MEPIHSYFAHSYFVRSYFEEQCHEIPSTEQVQYNHHVHRLMHRVAQRIDIQVRLALGPIPQLPQNSSSLLLGLCHHNKTPLMLLQSEQVNLLYKDVCNGALYTLRSQLPDSSFVSNSVSLFVLHQFGGTDFLENYIRKVAFEELYNEGLIVPPNKPRLSPQPIDPKPNMN